MPAATVHVALIVDRVLLDPENDLGALVRAFRRSGEPVWHLDRHVLEVEHEAGPEVRLAACSAGVELFRMWVRQRTPELGSDVLISDPYLVVDDGWIGERPGVAPPHVYVCLYKAGARDGPVSHPGAKEFPRGAVPELGSLLGVGERLSRLEGVFEDEHGAWIVSMYMPPGAVNPQLPR